MGEFIMAKSNSTKSRAGKIRDARIPKHIHNFNAHAERFDLATSSVIRDGAIQTVWQGTENQFRATGLVTPGFKFPKQISNFWNKYLWEPHWHGASLANEGSGRFCLSSENEVPVNLKSHTNPAIEILEYESNGEKYNNYILAYYGAPDDLIKEEIIRRCDIPTTSRKRTYTYKTGVLGDGREWKVIRQINGHLIFNVETEESLRIRNSQKETRATLSEQRNYAPGVSLSIEKNGMREYCGTSRALVDAGVIVPDLLPGAPGQQPTYAYGDWDGKHFVAEQFGYREIRVIEWRIETWNEICRRSRHDGANNSEAVWLSEDEIELLRFYRLSCEAGQRMLRGHARIYIDEDFGLPKNVINFDTYRQRRGYL
jgi:hypothetical protein